MLSVICPLGTSIFEDIVFVTKLLVHEKFTHTKFLMVYYDISLPENILSSIFYKKRIPWRFNLRSFYSICWTEVVRLSKRYNKSRRFESKHAKSQLRTPTLLETSRILLYRLGMVSIELLLLVDVVIRFLHWPNIQV